MEKEGGGVTTKLEGRSISKRPCASMRASGAHLLHDISHGAVHTPIPRLALEALPCTGGENMSIRDTRCLRTRHSLSIAAVIWVLTAANVWNCAALAIKINGGSMCGDRRMQSKMRK